MIPTLENTRKFGVGYKGSKSKIAKQLIMALPAADHFYDLFAGGCAVTHAAMVSGKYKHVHANDLNGQGLKLFLGAIEGKYKDRYSHFIDRHEFARLKTMDEFVSICYSFGNDQGSYMFDKVKREPLVKAAHKACFGDNEDLTKLFPHCEPFVVKGNSIAERYGSYREWKNKNIKDVKELEQLGRLQQLEQLEQLERLQQLDGLLISTFLDYRQVEIKENSVIYCDIPYHDTSKYDAPFSHSAFYAWVEKNSDKKIFVSEYKKPKIMSEFLRIETRSAMSAGYNMKIFERVFSNIITSQSAG